MVVSGVSIFTESLAFASTVLQLALTAASGASSVTLPSASIVNVIPVIVNTTFSFPGSSSPSCCVGEVIVMFILSDLITKESLFAGYSGSQLVLLGTNGTNTQLFFKKWSSDQGIESDPFSTQSWISFVITSIYPVSPTAGQH